MGLIPFIRASQSWISWTSQTSWALSAIGTQLLRLSPALVIHLFLLLMGLKRRDFFLVKGRIDAIVEPSKLVDTSNPEPWTRIGIIFGIIFAGVTFAGMVIALKPSVSAFVGVVPLIPVVLLMAAMNAFNEEFSYRAGPLFGITAGCWQATSTHKYFSVFLPWPFLRCN